MQTVEIELSTINCGQCGGTYAINERFRKQCQEHSRSWHCPYCDCSWGYRGPTAAERERAKRLELERRLRCEEANHERTREELDHTEHRRRAEKAAKTRIKRRVGAGLCPCCNRSFRNLAEHMKTKHPSEVPDSQKGVTC